MANTITNLVDRYAEVNAKYLELKDEKEILRREIQQKMEEEDLKTVKGTNGRSVTLSDPKLRVSVLAADRDEFIDWLDSMGEGDIAQRKFTPAAANKIVEHILETKGEDLIPEKFREKIDFFQNITVRGGNK